MARTTGRTGRSMTLATRDEPEAPAEDEAEAPTGDAAETKPSPRSRSKADAAETKPSPRRRSKADVQAEDEQAEDAQAEGELSTEEESGHQTETHEALASDEVDAQTEDTDEPVDDDPDSPTPELAAKGLDPPKRGRAFRAALVVLSVLCVALAAATVVFGMRWQDDRAADAGRNGALAAARQSALNLTSINYNSADTDVNKVISGATGDFHNLFTQNLSSYVDVVKKNQVVTTGQVTEAGVQDINAKTAHIILAVQSNVRNAAAPKGEVRTYRMALQMEHQGNGSWLVSRVDFVP